jgi:cytochrome c oxidase assembly factor CtaG
MRSPSAGAVAGASAVLLLLASGPAAAHGAEASRTAGGEPWLVALLGLAAVAYAVGWRRLAARAAHGRPRLVREAALYGSGWLVLAGALLSPLHSAGARSFTLHMLEHELLMLVAAPLLALSRPLTTMLWALPAAARGGVGAISRGATLRTVWRVLTDPWTATTLQAAALWLWHVPALFERALQSEGWHYAQHASFFASALVFWWSITGARGRRSGAGVGAFCLFVTSLVGGALGALMALSTSPWYEGYAKLGLAPFGLSPAEDQQLAGLLMWIPGGLVHAGAALWMLGAWLRRGGSSGAAPRDAEVQRAA